MIAGNRCTNLPQEVLFLLHHSSYVYFYILLHSCISLDQGFQSGLLFLDPSLHVPNGSGYKELEIDFLEPLQSQPRKTWRMPMGDKNKDEGVGDPIKIFLKEALEKKSSMMMDNFSQILQRLPIDDTSASINHFGGATSFKVYVNF